MNSYPSLTIFTLPLAQAVKAADWLVRDHKGDDRALSLECIHLRVKAAGDAKKTGQRWTSCASALHAAVPSYGDEPGVAHQLNQP